MAGPAACVILADRHPAILSALKRVLEPEFEVVAMVDNVISLIDALKASNADALVIDIAMLAEDNEHLARYLARAHPGTPVVLIGDDTAGVPAPVQGIASRFVSKSTITALLLPAVAAAVGEARAWTPTTGDF